MLHYSAYVISLGYTMMLRVVLHQQKEQNIISAGQENRSRTSVKHFFNIGTVILEVNLINKDATYSTWLNSNSTYGRC